MGREGRGLAGCLLGLVRKGRWSTVWPYSGWVWDGGQGTRPGRLLCGLVLECLLESKEFAVDVGAGLGRRPGR